MRSTVAYGFESAFLVEGYQMSLLPSMPSFRMSLILHCATVCE